MSKRLGLFLLLTMLLGLTLGCGLGGLVGGDEEAPPAAEGEETPPTADLPSGDEEAEPPSGDVEAGEEEEEDVDLSSATSGLSSLDTYRSYFELSFEGTTDGEAERWTYEMDMEYVRDPLAQRVVISGSGMGEGAEGVLETVRIGDMQYIVVGEGQCISSSAEESEEMDMEIFEPDEAIGGLSSARRVRPDETVNGVLCRHYKFDERGITWSEVTNAKGEVWVAVDGDYVVKYTLEADGKNPVSGGDEGHIEWLYEVRDVNQPISIGLPAGCGTAESEFPLMSDAAEMTTMGGMVMYSSTSSFDDVLAFYQDQMPAEGWSDSGESFVGSGTAMLGYTKDGSTATITLTEEEGKVSVIIMSE